MKGMDLIEGIFTDATVDDGLHSMRRVAQTASGHLVCDAQDSVRRTIDADQRGAATSLDVIIAFCRGGKI
jgi:hypothetical protein